MIASTNFLDLPPETRNYCYDYMLENVEQENFLADDGDENTNYLSLNNFLYLIRNMTQVSDQIHDELKSRFYHSYWKPGRLRDLCIHYQEYPWRYYQTWKEAQQNGRYCTDGHNLRDFYEYPHTIFDRIGDYSIVPKDIAEHLHLTIELPEAKMDDGWPFFQDFHNERILRKLVTYSHFDRSTNSDEQGSEFQGHSRLLNENVQQGKGQWIWEGNKQRWITNEQKTLFTMDVQQFEWNWHSSEYLVELDVVWQWSTYGECYYVVSWKLGGYLTQLRKLVKEIDSE